MNLFDVVADNLFSLLSYKTKYVYADALFVLYDAFKQQLKIKKSTLISMFISNLETKMMGTDFDGELTEDEQTVSGRAYFLVRKLKSTGWISIESGADFEEYIILPDYSIKLLDAFSDLTTESTISGFSFVYDTYASLKSAKEEGGAYEKMMAVYGAYDKTQSLINTLKTVYHNINHFCQEQMDMTDVNKVLAAHYDHFSQKIIEQYIRPLKVKDSVPKYKIPIMNVLDLWLLDNDVLNEMANSAVLDKRGPTIAHCKQEIIHDIYYVKDTYEKIEREYIQEIDSKVRKYTRATTQKIEYLTNSDKNLRGNLIFLLQHMAKHPRDTDLLDQVQETFQLFEQQFISEKSLYTRKRGKDRLSNNRLLIENEPEDFTDQAKETYASILNNQYSKIRVQKFVSCLLGQSGVAYSKDISMEDDSAYVLSLLAVLNSADRDSFYRVEFLEGEIQQNKYEIPNVRFVRKEQ